MKYLKYFLVLLLLLTLIFFAMGLIKPQVNYECSVLVDKPVEESWAVMNDESKHAEWILGYLRSELVSGEAGKVGAVSNVFVSDKGKEMSIQETIKSIQENDHIAMDFSMDFMNMDYRMQLAPEGNKTRITTTSEVVGNGMIAKSMIAMMGSGMKEQETTNITNLKNTIEASTTNYFPIEEEVEQASEEGEEVTEEVVQ